MFADALQFSAATSLALALSSCDTVPIQLQDGNPPVLASATLSPGQPTPRYLAAPAWKLPAGTIFRAIRVHPYPLSNAAAELGPLHDVITDRLGGSCTLCVLAGEQLQGEAARVPDYFPCYGRVIAGALSEAPLSHTVGKRVIANASGMRDHSAQGEYVLSSATLSIGACVLSNGANGQLHFGS